MAEIATVLELQELSAEEASNFWRVAQLMIYGLLSIMGFAVYYSLSNGLESFAGHCPFGAQIVFHAIDEKLHVMDYLNSKWQQDYVCHVCVYVPATTLLVAVIWFALLFMSGYFTKSGAQSVMQPWKIVVLNIFVTSTMFIACGYTMSLFGEGLAELCQSFEMNINSSPCSEMHKYLPMEELQATSSVLYDVYTCFVAGRICLWTLIWMWLGSCMISFLRICYAADFKLMQITLYRTPDNLVVLGQKSLVYVEPSSEASIGSTAITEHWLQDVDWTAAEREEVLEAGVQAFRFTNQRGIAPRKKLPVIPVPEPEPQLELEPETKEIGVQTSSILYVRRRTWRTTTVDASIRTQEHNNTTL